MRVVCAIEDPGAANGMVGLADALNEAGLQLEIFAAGAALNYAAGIGLTVRPLSALALPFDDAPYLPAAVLVGTSENPDSPIFKVTRAARDAGVPSFGFVDGPANAEHRFRGTGSDPLGHVPDRLLVSDPAARDAFVSLGFPRDAITVVGHPGMDRVRTRAAELETEGKAAVRARLFPDIDPSRQLVLFLCETSDGLDPAEFRRNDDYLLRGRGAHDGRTEICLEETIDALAAATPDASLVLRLHPKNETAAFRPYAGEVAAISAGGDPLEAVFAADLVIGMTTVLLFEAAVMRRPTISVTPRESEAAWLSSIALGLTRHVCSQDRLRASIADALKARGDDATAHVDGLVPAGAARRMADAIRHGIAI